MTGGLPGWENLGGHPWRIYEQSPLVLALCQIQFPTRLAINNPAAVAAFQDAIAVDYPETPPSAQNIAQIQFSGGDTQLPVNLPAPPVVWQFADRADNWSVALTQDFVTLETRSYEHFADFLTRLHNVVAVLIKTVAPPFCKRIGLRYINEIRPDDGDLFQVVRPQLLGPLVVEPFRSQVIQSVQHLILQSAEAQISLQHGILPGGTTVQPRPGENVQTDPFYLLDIDVSRESSVSSPALPMDSNDIGNCVSVFHDTISEVFRWATAEEYVSTLGERSNAVR